MSNQKNATGYICEVSLAPPYAYLWDFAIDGDQLRPHHRQWLEKNVIAPIQAATEPWTVYLQGTTSRTGSEAKNLNLSQRRAQNAQAFLASKISNGKCKFDTTWVGEAAAAAKGTPDKTEIATDRAVIVMAQKTVLPKPKPKPKPPLFTFTISVPAVSFGKFSTEFSIRMLRGVSGSMAPAGADIALFDVWDTKNNLAAYYQYVGAGLSAPLPTPPVSTTQKGPWNDFTTNVAVEITDFGGWASFISEGAGSFTKNGLLLKTDFEGLKIPMETGFTMGAGQSGTAGRFIWWPREYYRRAAPSP
jgi:hypothetical protein